jgi:hypothetical protein
MDYALRKIGDVVSGRASADCVGRQSELAFLGRLLSDDKPLIVGVHGIGGIGKSTLLAAFASQARARGAAVIQLDCRAIEPTEPGFLRELGAATGAELASAAEGAHYLGQLGARVILVLDTYERLRLLDTWLRQIFVPSLRDNVRIVLCGRDPLVAGWLTAPGWHGLIVTLALGTLEERDALALLDRNQISSADAWRIIRLTRGHPLALKLAMAAMSGRRMVDVEAAVLPRVVEELTRLYLADIDDPIARQALAASSVVRRTTLSLLAAMLPQVPPQDAYDHLLGLAFVETSHEGLHIHDTVQQVIAATLKSADPATHQAYRRAAWRQLRSEVRTAGARGMWRYTADMLYIIENPVTREAFFPSNMHRFAVEAARPADEARIETIVKRHEGPQGAAWLMGWWRRAPQAFRAIRDHEGMLTGLYALFDPATLDPSGAEHHDPIVGPWLTHLQRNPIGATEQVLFSLRWLSETGGEAPAPEQAAAWLDIKRSYMEMRPRLRRVYMTVVDVTTYGPIAAELGFRLLDDLTAVLDDKAYHTALLDFGPQSVDGWLTGLVAKELGLEEHGLENERLLDIEGRELVLRRKRVPLTPLEFDVMRLLTERPGTAISRTILLDTVWGVDYEGGSNVVDAVIRLLRRKLGGMASCIETVSGVGYRFRVRPDQPQP